MILHARMIRLGVILDELTAKALALQSIMRGEMPLLMQENLQAQMTAMRIEARQLVKTIRLEVKQMKEGA